MSECLFLAGATGAIGRRLAPLLVAAGWRVVVHQLTDLPPKLDPSRMAEATGRNARIRDEGTRNLVAAALAAGVRRMIAQSIAFAYADGPLPHNEDDPLDLGAQGSRGVSVGGVVSLERQVLEASMEGIVLRYGRLYGPGTGADASAGPGALHVDAAACCGTGCRTRRAWHIQHRGRRRHAKQREGKARIGMGRCVASGAMSASTGCSANEHIGPPVLLPSKVAGDGLAF